MRVIKKSYILIKRRQSTARYSPHRRRLFLSSSYIYKTHVRECRRDITVKALKHCGKIYWKKIKSQFDKKRREYIEMKKKKGKKMFTCETQIEGERERECTSREFVHYFLVCCCFSSYLFHITTAAMLHSFVIIMACEWVRKNEEWKKINKNVDAAETSQTRSYGERSEPLKSLLS